LQERGVEKWKYSSLKTSLCAFSYCKSHLSNDLIKVFRHTLHFI
jgi:hypothetical protein